MKNILFITLLITSTLFSQKNNKFLVDNNSIQEFYFNKLPLFKITQPGNDFSNLKVFGKPKNISTEKSIVEVVTKLEYDGFELTYVNNNGYPDLVEFIIKDVSKINIAYKDEKLTNNELFKKAKSKIKTTNIQGKFINDEEFEYKKFKSNFSFMEIEFNDTQKTVKSIKLKFKTI